MRVKSSILITLILLVGCSQFKFQTNSDKSSKRILAGNKSYIMHEPNGCYQLAQSNDIICITGFIDRRERVIMSLLNEDSIVRECYLFNSYSKFIKTDNGAINFYVNDRNNPKVVMQFDNLNTPESDFVYSYYDSASGVATLGRHTTAEFNRLDSEKEVELFNKVIYSGLCDRTNNDDWLKWIEARNQIKK